MRPILRLFGCCLIFAGLFDARAYEQATHAEVFTRAAVSQSIVQTDPTVLRNLGLDKGVADVFPNSEGRSRTIQELFEDGSRFEDSVFPTIRPFRHFYNPLNSQGLSTLILPIQTSSPDWALAVPDTMPGQEFSYWNARQYLFDALTKPSKTERRNAFGRSFQALGQVMHHLQDMGQPQHVRNDIHCDNLACVFIGGYASSLYENWTNQNRGSLPTDFSSIGYDITSPAFTSTFNSPRRFWNTEPPGPNSPVTGKGIAEFTNRNFVSAGTIFFSDATGFHPNPNFALPAPGPIGERITIAKLMPGTSLTGEV